MNIKYATLVLLFVKSITAAGMSSWRMAEELMMTVGGKDLERTFKEFEEEEDEQLLGYALAEVAGKEKYRSKAVRCLEIAEDRYPDEASRVSKLVHIAVEGISDATLGNTEAFANIVASFKSSAVKPLASIRFWILWRNDAKDVLKQVMAKSRELILGSLSRWLASHSFDQKSKWYVVYKSAREQAFEYLVSFATESVLNEALIIAKQNEHYGEYHFSHCCDSEKSYPYDLINKLETRLNLVQRRNALNGSLAFWPAVLIDLVEGYLIVGNLSAETPSTTEKPITLIEHEPWDQAGHTSTTSVSPSNTGLSKSHTTTKMTSDAMTRELIAAEDEDLEAIFKELEREQDGNELRDALKEVARNEEHRFEAVRCLEIVNDPYPEEASRVSGLVDNTVSIISAATCTNTEAFVKAAVSLDPSAIKLHASTQYQILWRDDVEGVLKQVMAMYPGLITGILPRWLTSHRFDRNYIGYNLYKSVRKPAFEHLVSQTTVLTLIEVLVVAKKNEHYKVGPRTQCCTSEACYPSDLIRKLMTLIIQRREELLGGILTLLPAVPISLIGDYFNDLPVETPSITEKPSTPAESEFRGQTEHTPTVRCASPSNVRLDRSHDRAISSQPSQMAKIFMILVLAWILSKLLDS